MNIKVDIYTNSDLMNYASNILNIFGGPQFL